MVTTRQWAQMIKRRDIDCQQCGSFDKLEAHHILPFILYTKLSLILNNGILLCLKCHTEAAKLNQYEETEQNKHYQYYYD